MSNPFAEMQEGCEHNLQEVVEEKVKLAFAQHSLGLSIDVARADTSSNSANAQLTTIISEVLNEIQPVIMKAVATAITSTTEIIVQNLKQDMDSITSAVQDIRVLKNEGNEQKSSTEKLE